MPARLIGNHRFVITFDMKVLRSTVGEVVLEVDGHEYHLRAGEKGIFEVPIDLIGGDPYIVRNVPPYINACKCERPNIKQVLPSGRGWCITCDGLTDSATVVQK